MFTMRAILEQRVVLSDLFARMPEDENIRSSMFAAFVNAQQNNAVKSRITLAALAEFIGRNELLPMRGNDAGMRRISTETSAVVSASFRNLRQQNEMTVAIEEAI